MDRLVRYPTDRNICISLFLIPIGPYTMPDNISMTPATANAGVMVGIIGRVSSSFGSCGEVVLKVVGILDVGFTDVENDDCAPDMMVLAVETVPSVDEVIEGELDVATLVAAAKVDV